MPKYYYSNTNVDQQWNNEFDYTEMGQTGEIIKLDLMRMYELEPHVTANPQSSLKLVVWCTVSYKIFQLLRLNY